MSYPQPDEVRPDWSFSPEHDVRCPRCRKPLNGLYWVFDQKDKLTGMMLDPCGHCLFTDQWELSFSGRDRKFGTVIRTPKFVRKAT